MIRHTFEVPQHRWTFRVYIALTEYWADEILGHLWRLGAARNVMQAANANLRSGRLNGGLTYASPGERETLIVVAKTSSAAELFNSIVHELDHAALFTFRFLGITSGTEEAAYFKGGLAREIVPLVETYMCTCCRAKI